MIASAAARVWKRLIAPSGTGVGDEVDVLELPLLLKPELVLDDEPEFDVRIDSTVAGVVADKP